MSRAGIISTMEKTQINRGETMQAIELEAEVSNKHEITLKLPENISAGMVKVIVMFEEEPRSVKKRRTFGQFKGKIKINDDFDDALPDSFWTGGKP